MWDLSASVWWVRLPYHMLYEYGSFCRRIKSFCFFIASRSYNVAFLKRNRFFTFNYLLWSRAIYSAATIMFFSYFFLFLFFFARYCALKEIPYTKTDNEISLDVIQCTGINLRWKLLDVVCFLDKSQFVIYRRLITLLISVGSQSQRTTD
jgi:hypothetical protein